MIHFVTTDTVKTEAVTTKTVTTNTELISVERHDAAAMAARLAAWRRTFLAGRLPAVAGDPRWLPVLATGLRQAPYCLEAQENGRTVGLLPLVHVKSLLFGSFLVSLPYINSAGVIADSDRVAARLIDEAVLLADQLDVRYLELRHEQRREHVSLTHDRTDKVHMRLALPATADALWNSFHPKVRNQIRKGEKQGFTISWGAAEQLDDFYAVFARNMRDLGTPVFSRRLFAAILTEFRDEAELCVLRDGRRPVAAALLLHGATVTEAPSASSLRAYNASNANMFMYWQLLGRTVERRQAVFDFGRSSVDSGTYRFKKQWGAQPHPAVWQYYVRRGDIGELRPDNAKYRLLVSAWQKLPVWTSKLIGPPIVRGIP